MRAVLFLGLLLCLGCLNAQPIPEKKAIRKAIEEFFDAFHAQHPARLKRTAGPGCILKSISVNGEGQVIVSTQTFDGFVKTVTTLPETVDFREKLLSFDIRHDGLMAHAWTPYEFYYDHKLHHTGVNSFVLFRDEKGEWKIIGITDTRKKNISR
ncbi:nuclear transport factor 2 family protein [Sinomicrobium weinanense]|uniref:Nuclear transport factor 2 family protein n=1 Tax=Sinomicrobium weinanense TaxID=2842200 RepID=A0A926Q514_9FLAO|nr:nuclear transport factor 2 family protein [Sinomicrobium weinanense]MBC9798594.1 nuclear transport factor 2 family protein [Sinomicrobium weinanense]MBU3122374.1 nuclear transport factor 2 family protein [Sinomicrobium weinanense]